MVEPDPYNLRLTRKDTFCLSGVRIPPGLRRFCHETPISGELLARQAPELATVQRLLHELRRRTRHAGHLRGGRKVPPLGRPLARSRPVRRKHRPDRKRSRPRSPLIEENREL